MQKKVTLSDAVQKCLDGKTVTAVLDVRIGCLTINELMALEDMGADFLAEAGELSQEEKE